MREAFSLLFLRSFDIRYEINETCHRGTLLFDTIAKKFIKIFIFIQDQQSERERERERKKERKRREDRASSFTNLPSYTIVLHNHHTWLV
jgi:hypothetical protein